MSLKERIISYAMRHPYEKINGGHYELLAMNAGYKSSNASRRLRELAEEGVLIRYENEKGHVEYAYIPKEKVEVRKLAQAALI